MWLTDEPVLVGRAVGLSSRGLSLVRSKRLPIDTVGLGETSCAAVGPELQAGLHGIAAPRHRRGDAVAVETREELPRERSRTVDGGQHQRGEE